MMCAFFPKFRTLMGITLTVLGTLCLSTFWTPSFAHDTDELVEVRPRVDLRDYFREGKIPKFIQVNIDGYHVRTSADFDRKRRDNIDFKTTKGTVYAVRNVIPMRKGIAVNIVIDGKDRYVYVPSWRKDGFRFCESEACFSTLAEFLKVLQDNNVSGEDLQTCGITISADGNPMGPGFENFEAAVPDLVAAASRSAEAPESAVVETAAGKAGSEESDLRISTKSPDVEIPTIRPKARPRENMEMAALEEEIAPRSSLKVKLFWETQNPPSASVGRRWTQQLLEAIDTHGKGLVEQRSLGDKRNWCPNYSRLSKSDRREFWAHLMVAVAERESGFKPTVNFNESTKRNDYRGRIKPNDHSQGLFQLSYGSAGQRTYRKFCKFDWGRDKRKDLSDRSLTIYDVEKQMDCAVGILSHWVQKDDGVGFKNGSKWRGGARFWSTLRSNNPATKKVKQRLKRFSPCFE